MNRLIRELRALIARPFLISFFYLVLFSVFLPACNQISEQAAASILWKNKKAVAIKIPVSLLNDRSGKQLTVKLRNASESNMLGRIIADDDTLLFEPLVPFTRGLHYYVYDGESSISEIEIPQSDSALPELIAVYPSQDTIPANLLKMYLQFSQPMQEGSSLSHITVLQNDDTLIGTFLDLQPELWNNEGTVLTIWLDPGRIKRDLIPNKTLGAPLHSAGTYILTVDNKWKSKEGKTGTHVFEKSFITIARDELSPAPESWKIKLPSGSTKSPVIVNFNEPLDYSLAKESISITDSRGNLISGSIEVINEEKAWSFTPDDLWTTGSYVIKIDSKLEDLAGNNLNRPFDTDLKKKQSVIKKEVFEKYFTIQ